ncbi:MAG: hypothetical protein GY862_32105 [Gammaproteobacteria bacterium]|nr:hypothetical protein [Gammaproteobacteria bacterium]
MIFSHDVVSSVPEPRVRHKQLWGLKHLVNTGKASGTLGLLWKMSGMDNVSKPLFLSIVTSAELEPPFGSGAKTARRTGRRVLTVSLHT